MELREAARRILLQHWLLIACLVVVGVAVGAIHGHRPPEYTASTRLTIGTDDPKSRTESGSIADTAKAIATSPTQVRRALEDAKVDRNPTAVARDHVSVSGLGTSGVVQISVSDKDPDAAQAIANALAHRVIRVRRDVVSGQVEAVVGDLTQRLDSINAKISSADQEIDRLSLEAARGGASGNSNLAQRDEALRQRDLLAQQRSSLESERISVLSAGATRQTPLVISAANVPTQTDSSAVSQDAILGALLGLVIGIGIAGLVETFRPTLVGSDSLAREFDTPLLGTVPTEEDEQLGRQALTRIALRLRLAADSINAHDVGLVAVGPDVELGLLAATMDELANDVLLAAKPRRIASAGGVASRAGRPVSSTESEGPGGLASAPAAARVRIRPFGLLEGRSDNGNTAALVLVSPNVVKKDDVEEVTHLLRLADAPLLGLITYARPRERRSRFDLSALRRR